MDQKSLHNKAMYYFNENGARGIEELTAKEDLYQVKIFRTDRQYIDEVIDWCEATCPISFFCYIDTFYFRNESDAIMAKLKFG